MKVGTDGVLLAAWCAVADAKTILDVGAGSGLISIIAAQRNPNAVITGIELDEQASAQARQNYNNCPWTDRLILIHDRLQSFAANSGDLFDHIISNPPFFEDIRHSKPSGAQRRIARNDSQLNLR